MSKQFAMLTATRRLENHLSRESYNLTRMADNDRIPHSLFTKKVAHHNELVDALNDLFASLTDSPTSKLFSSYFHTSDEGLVPDIESEDAPPSLVVQEVFEFIPQPAAEPEVPLWKTEGYESRESWLADKEAEFVQSPDDLTLGVNDAMSRYRAEQALTEYSETSERDIATYLPEEDTPVSVLPLDEEDEEFGSDSNEVTAADYNYLDHTVDNVRVDSDPTQIAGVETAVERYGENARKGTDIDVSSYLYQPGGFVIDDLIDDDIERLHASDPVTAESGV
ncbi:hypothetical protein [Metabacillus sp. SLBN-84]